MFQDVTIVIKHPEIEKIAWNMTYSVSHSFIIYGLKVTELSVMFIIIIFRYYLIRVK